jgi:hypothetical protein
MQFRDSPIFERNISPPSSRLKSKPSKKPAETGLLSAYAVQAVYTLHGVVTQMTILLHFNNYFNENHFYNVF